MRRFAAIVLLACFAGCEVSDEPPAIVVVETAESLLGDPDLPQPIPLSAVPSSVDIETLPAAVSPPAARPKVVHGKVAFIDGFDRGVEAAVQQGKPMLVFFTAEWCHYCHQMAAEAFADSNVATLSERFVCILVDADAEPRVCRRFRVKSFPTVQFLSSRRTPLNRLVGKRSTADLLRQMHAALQAVARSDERESSAKR